MPVRYKPLVFCTSMDEECQRLKERTSPRLAVPIDRGIVQGVPMRVLVAGSGEWTDADPIRRELAKLPTGATIVCGDFAGADAMAAQVGRELGLTVESFKKEPEDYRRYGRGAWKGLNERMLASGVDQVLAFHAAMEKSKGTKQLVELAREKGVLVEVFRE